MFPPRMNFIWSRDPQEAYQQPYEYDAQNQFIREADAVLNAIFLFLMKSNRKYSIDERSIEKAVWMLHVDACESLRDGVKLLEEGRHRIANRLIRDVIELADLAYYFSSNEGKSLMHLENWYDDSIIPHSNFRDWIGKQEPNIKKILVNEYRSISKFTHRTYRVLAYNYINAMGDMLAYDGEEPKHKIPHPISLCCALFAHYIKYFAVNLILCRLMTEAELTQIFENSIEDQPIERMFVVPKEILDRLAQIKNK